MSYKVDEAVCRWCGRKVKKNDRLLFKDKMRRKLNEVNE